MKTSHYKGIIIKNNQLTYGLIDAHCHIDNGHFLNDPTFLNALSQLEYTIMISSILNKKDLDISSDHLTIDYTAGLHPYMFKEMNFDLAFIDSLCRERKLIGIGEIGLDFRFNNTDEQTKILLQQLEIANSYQLPVVFHCVKAYPDLKKILNNNFPKTIGVIHGFTGNSKTIEIFNELNITFSISRRLSMTKNFSETIKYLIKKQRLVFESDSEYHLIQNCEELINHYQSIEEMIHLICLENSISYAQIIQIQFDNIKRIFYS